MEDFDFVFQSSIDRRQIAKLGNLAFVERAKNVDSLGVGKTNLAWDWRLKPGSWQSGLLYHLIEDLKKAQLQDRLDRRWQGYLRPAILKIDEIGYSQLKRLSYSSA